jgi:hypothetical protein
LREARRALPKLEKIWATEENFRTPVAFSIGGIISRLSVCTTSRQEPFKMSMSVTHIYRSRAFAPSIGLAPSLGAEYGIGFWPFGVRGGHAV